MTAQDQFDKLANAMHELFMTSAKVLHIPQVLEWLTERILAFIEKWLI